MHLEEFMDLDVVHKALMALLRQYVKALFKHIGSVEEPSSYEIIREKSLEDVTGAEFRMFVDFLKSLSIFEERAPAERVKELIGLVEKTSGFRCPIQCSTCFIVLI